MKFPWKTEKKAEQSAEMAEMAETLSEEVLEQIWGGGVMKADCHCETSQPNDLQLV